MKYKNNISNLQNYNNHNRSGSILESNLSKTYLSSSNFVINSPKNQETPLFFKEQHLNLNHEKIFQEYFHINNNNFKNNNNHFINQQPPEQILPGKVEGDQQNIEYDIYDSDPDQYPMQNENSIKIRKKNKSDDIQKNIDIQNSTFSSVDDSNIFQRQKSESILQNNLANKVYIQKLDEKQNKVEAQLKMANIMNIAISKVENDLNFDKDTKLLIKEMKQAINFKIQDRTQKSQYLLSKSQKLFQGQFQDIQNKTIATMRKIGQTKIKSVQKTIDNNPEIREKQLKLRLVRLLTFVIPMILLVFDSIYAYTQATPFINLVSDFDENEKYDDNKFYQMYRSNLMNLTSYCLYLSIAMSLAIIYLNYCGFCNNISSKQIAKTLKQQEKNKQKLKEKINKTKKKFEKKKKSQKQLEDELWKKHGKKMHYSQGFILFLVTVGFVGQWISTTLFVVTDYSFDGELKVLTDVHNEEYQELIGILWFIIWLPAYIIPVQVIVWYCVGKFMLETYYGTEEEQKQQWLIEQQLQEKEEEHKKHIKELERKIQTLMISSNGGIPKPKQDSIYIDTIRHGQSQQQSMIKSKLFQNQLSINNNNTNDNSYINNHNINNYNQSQIGSHIKQNGKNNVNNTIKEEKICKEDENCSLRSRSKSSDFYKKNNLKQDVQQLENNTIYSNKIVNRDGNQNKLIPIKNNQQQQIINDNLQKQNDQNEIMLNLPNFEKQKKQYSNLEVLQSQSYRLGTNSNKQSQFNNTNIIINNVNNEQQQIQQQ